MGKQKEKITQKHPKGVSPGRPSKIFSEETREKILKAIRAGAFIETAASYAGVSKPTLYAWFKRGNEQKRGIYKDFLNAIQEAWATATVADLEQIAAAASKDWRAAAYRLEQRERAKYGPHVKLTGPDGGPVEINLAAIVQRANRVIAEHEGESSETGDV